jgi:nucleotide-binding universal stress UspA family protein
MRFRPGKIICAIDFSNFTDTILSYSVALCKKYNAKLFLIHVTVDVRTLLEHNETALDLEALQKSNIRDAQDLLENTAKDLTVENEIIIRQGTPADAISRFASEQKADMVITATHGKSGFKRFLLGSVTEKLMKNLHCPLLILPMHGNDVRSPAGFEMKLKKILVGCDFSPDSKLAVDCCLSLAQEFQAELYLLHVIKPSLYKDEREKLDKLYNELDGQLNDMVPEACRDWCIAKTTLLEGEPYLELTNYANEHDIDLVVLGIRGHTLFEKLLVGSTTDRLIRHASFPVFVVR